MYESMGNYVFVSEKRLQDLKLTMIFQNICCIVHIRVGNTWNGIPDGVHTVYNVLSIIQTCEPPENLFSLP